MNGRIAEIDVDSFSMTDMKDAVGFRWETCPNLIFKKGIDSECKNISPSSLFPHT